MIEIYQHQSGATTLLARFIDWNDLCVTDLRGVNWQHARLEEAYMRSANLCGANLCGANLDSADLYRAKLANANLRGANLNSANLHNANLRGADLRSANLAYADLRKANLAQVDLCGANLRGVDLNCANLRGANLDRANLYGADLQGADLTNTRLPAFQIPQEGDLTVWKKARQHRLVKLLIPDGALRTASLVGRKCRARQAEVLWIEGDVSTVRSRYDRSFVYTVGEEVEAPDYDDDPRVECTGGIHFFLTRDEASEY